MPQKPNCAKSNSLAEELGDESKNAPVHILNKSKIF